MDHQDNVNSTLQSLAFGNAMLAAAKDYKKELIEAEKPKKAEHDELDVDELLDDPELERLHAERLAQLKENMEKRSKESEWIKKGHGQLTEIDEGDFLEIVTKTDRVLCHFFHRDFERCKILNNHLIKLADKHKETKFVKLSAPDAPFFVEKLKVKVLPCVIYFISGIATGRLVGFEELGRTDAFSTSILENKLIESKVIFANKTQCHEMDNSSNRIKRSTLYNNKKSDDDDDESSDFEN